MTDRHEVAHRPAGPGNAPDLQLPPWHALSATETMLRLATGAQGLGSDEAARRLRDHGPNRLPEPRPVPPLVRFARHFANLLIYVLLAAAAVTAALGDWLETGVILAVVLLNGIVGYAQEGRAEAALVSLRSMLALRASVRRDGVRAVVDAVDLVPGDFVLVEAGDRVPADVRLVTAHDLRVEEAALTGESVPVVKREPAVDERSALGDRTSMLYAGTSVTSGAGRGVVVATGTHTEVGRIGQLVQSVTTLRTPFLVAIDAFSRTLAIVILVAAAVLFGYGWWVRGDAFQEIFLTVVGFAVAAIPEGLPAIITITLALGVQRMARRNAIVRRLPAVETLGAVTTICSDKTGTLTKNEMTVRRVVTCAGTYRVGGEGYEPDGAIDLGDAPVEPADHDDLRELVLAAALTSDAELRRTDDGGRVLVGDPTDGATIVLAEKVGIEPASAEASRVDRLPFASEQGYSASLHREAVGGACIAYVKGAPERLLARCGQQRSTTGGEEPLDRERWERALTELAADGHRVLAVACKTMANDTVEITHASLRDGLAMLGFVAMIDPPRAEASASIAKCRRAGIRVVMITGDHALTATSIARELGLEVGDRAITGTELDGLDTGELDRVVAEHDVFARASPENKLAILEALQRRGEVTAMTGDGVNDAPALKRADVGIAMGVKGSEVAKEASEMVLGDDDFSTIAIAVEEGRAIDDNLKKTILFMLPTNGAEALVVVASVLAVFHVLPVTPVQILWVNMITAVTLALSLAFEPPEANVMLRPPRAKGAAVLSTYLVGRIVYVSVVIAGLTLVAFWLALERGMDLAAARTVAVNTLVAGQLFYLLNTRFLFAPALGRRFFGNPVVFASIAALVLFQVLFTYFPPLQAAFDTAAIDFAAWRMVALAGAFVFFVVEVEKAITRRRGPTRAQRR
ncbi:MAG: HAD-IC family P-type ATPase [Trueperaceae bacterium]